MIQKIKCFFGFHIKQNLEKASIFTVKHTRGIFNQIVFGHGAMNFVNAMFICPACHKQHEDSWHYPTGTIDERGFKWP